MMGMEIFSKTKPRRAYYSNKKQVHKRMVDILPFITLCSLTSIDHGNFYGRYIST